MMTPSAHSTVALALDLGGTKVEAALVQSDGVIIAGSRVRAPTGERARSADQADQQLEFVVNRVLAHPRAAEAVGAGVGSAGPIDLPRRTVSPINLPGLRDYPLADRVGEMSGLDTTLRLDGTCIALAEQWLGAASDHADAIIIVVSTGIGGGIVSGGRLVAGATGNAGHLGQTIIERVEADPALATVERIASGPASVEWARSQGWSGATGEDLAAAYRAGDAIARAAVARSAEAVGTALANAATLLDLDLAVVGGGFSSVAEDYIERVGLAARARAVNSYARRMVVVPASLGGDAPLIGAAALVHRRDLLA